MAAACALAASPAQARVPVAAAHLPVALTIGAYGACSPLAPDAQPRGSAAAALGMSKQSAILGGAISQLELIRMQQAGSQPVATNPVEAPAGLTPALPAPAANSGAAPPQPCASIAAIREPAFTPGLGQSAPGEFLASTRLKIAKTAFDSDWRRVARKSLSSDQVAKVLGEAPRSGEALLAQVNARVNRTVTYREDRDLFGRADYWADARATLRRGAGDCEDIAIVKMQLLAAAGVRREDMFLTIARDLIRNADHAVLVVKSGNRFLMLDNAVDTVLDAGPANGYRPILSFGEGQAWLHGYASAPVIRSARIELPPIVR